MIGPRMQGGSEVRRGLRWLTAAIVATAAAAATAFAATLDFSERKYPAGIGPEAVAVGDFNRDGNADLAVANFGGQPFVSILRGKDRGAFKPTGGYATGGNPDAIAIGRFDKGKDQDLAVATTGAVSVLLGKRGVKFGHSHSYGAYGTALAGGIAAADLDHDGRTDLTVSNTAGGGQLSVLFGIGPGVFGGQMNFPIGAEVGEVATARLNADNRADVVVTGPATDQVSVLLGNGGPSLFDPAQPYAAGPAPTGVALEDLDADGDKDIAVSDRDPTAQSKNVVSVLEGDGAGGFGAPQEVVLGDVVPKRGAPGANPVDVAVAQVDGDGRPDLVVALEASNEIAIVFGKGGLDFSKAHRKIVGSRPTFAAPSHLDRGKSVDLAVSLQGADKVAVLLNQR
jgi:hypothetical protein